MILLIIVLAIAKFSLSEISNFEECEKAGFPILKSNPRQCIAEGKTFVENLTPKEEFCGFSKGNCNQNSDCTTGGCSGQVCVAKPLIIETTC